MYRTSLLILLALALPSCVATAGDLRELNAAMAQAAQEASQRVDRALEEQEDALAELQTAQLQGATHEEVEQLRDEYQAAIENTKEELGEATEEAAATVGQAIDSKIEEIKERAEDIGAQVTMVADKAAEGPSGWLDLLLLAAGTSGVAGVGVNAHRNKTRKQQLGEATQQVSQQAVQQAAQVAQQVAGANVRAYQPPAGNPPPQPPMPPSPVPPTPGVPPTQPPAFPQG